MEKISILFPQTFHNFLMKDPSKRKQLTKVEYLVLREFLISTWKKEE